MRRQELHLEFGNDLVFVNKPAGLPTHAPDPQRLGLVELVERELQMRGNPRRPHVVHRLDKYTTGAMVLALTESRAQDLFAKFKNHEIKKRYLFLTDRHPAADTFEVSSHIEKVGKEFKNTTSSGKDANAFSSLKRLKLNAMFEQWEAQPKTGKPHQVRLHAAQVGLPLLGDTTYGGAAYPHLCLHSAEIAIPGEKTWVTPAPIFFERMGLLRDRDLVAQLSAWDRRERLFHFLASPDGMFRLSHLDQLDVRVDVFGPVLWVYWYREAPPTPRDHERWEFLGSLIKKSVVIRHMQNRGASPNQQTDWQLGSPPKIWTAKENEILFELRQHQGLSPGLFLDQRENRFWLTKQSQEKKVLNLFAYTCGFSVAAALGGAEQVISVDLSRSFLEWGKRNFILNHLDPEKSEFFAADSLIFLEGAEKRSRKFDIIICDPPSFSRNNKQVFRIEKDLPELLQKCWNVLALNGTLLLSTNYEKWSEPQLISIVQKVLNLGPQQITTPELVPLDFELPHESKLTKVLLLKKIK